MDEQTIIKQIRELAEKLGKTPTKREYNKVYRPTYNNIKFGRFSLMVEKAGLTLNYFCLSDEEIKRKFKNYIEKNGVPACGSIKIKGLPSFDVVQKRWGTYENFLKEIGYSGNLTRFSKKYTKDEMIKFLQEKVDDGSFRLHKDLKTKKELPYIDTVYKILDCKSFDDVIKIIDREKYFKKYKTKETSKIEKTNEELISDYIKLSKKINKTVYGATRFDTVKYLGIYSNFYAMRFGSFSNFRKEAGFEKFKNIKPKFTKEEVTELLLDEIKNKGRLLKVREIDADENFPSLTTIYCLFRTCKIKEIYEKIGANKIIK